MPKSFFGGEPPYYSALSFLSRILRCPRNGLPRSDCSSGWGFLAGVCRAARRFGGDSDWLALLLSPWFRARLCSLAQTNLGWRLPLRGIARSWNSSDRRGKTLPRGTPWHFMYLTSSMLGKRSNSDRF